MKTILAIGAHYDDCVFGIPGILLKAVARHHRVVILSLIGDYTNWPPAQGREKAIVDSTIAICREQGVEMRYLDFASQRFDVTLESKRKVAEVVADVKPDIAFMMWPRDSHADHEVASQLSKIALRHGGRVLPDGREIKGPSRIYLYDNGPRHTIGFEPNVFVDVSDVWEPAIHWLGKFMALVRNEPYDPAKRDGAQQVKESLALYRGQTCGVKYAEALQTAHWYPQDIL